MIKLIRKRRSIRNYRKLPLTKRELKLLVETALRSPSSRDIKPCEFIVVDDRALLEQLATSKEHGSLPIKEAAAAIVVCADKTKSDVWIEDCSIASILIQMTALSEGLGSCWIQIRNRRRSAEEPSEQYVRKLLALPEHIVVESIISIGWPAEKKKPVPASKLDYCKVRLNSYAEPFNKKTTTKKRGK